jgi:NADH-quinone oxidoreductase subunit F
MPAQEEEIKAAEEEGVKIQYLVNPVRFQGSNGKVEQVILRRMVLGEFDNSGRKKPVPKLGEDQAVDVDMVILAIGQETVFPFDSKGGAVPVNKNGFIEVIKGKKTATKAPMVFAGGDVVTGPDTVVGAIAAGHHAASEIDQAIRLKNGEAFPLPPEEEIDVPLIIDEEIHEAERACTLEAGCADRIKDFREVELGLSKEDAFKESCRCLRCDAKA